MVFRNLILTLIAFFAFTATFDASAGVREGREAGNRGDYATAYKEYYTLAINGDPDAQVYLSIIYQGGVKKDLKQARKWLQKAIDQNYAEAYFSLALYYHFGWGVPVDETKAAALYLKSAELGSYLGMMEIADRYRDGDGVPKNQSKHDEWYSRATAHVNDDFKKYIRTGDKTMCGLVIEAKPPIVKVQTPNKGEVWFEIAKMSPRPEDYTKDQNWTPQCWVDGMSY